MKKGFLHRGGRVLCVAALVGLSQVPLAAETIYGYTATLSNRFLSGYTSTPVMNTNSTYIGLNYDLSGVGWIDSSYGSGVSLRVQNLTMISPLNFAVAYHYSQNGLILGRQIDFVNADGQFIKTSAAALTGQISTGYGGDFTIGTLGSAFTTSQKIGVSRILDVANQNYVGMEMLVYGSEIDSTGPRVGNAVVTSQMGGTVTWSTHSPVRVGDAQYWSGGDSGSPAFLKYTAPDGHTELTLVGTAWYPTMLNSYLPMSGYDPTAALNNTIEGYGYALKWTIYDNAADTARTAAQWTGGTGNGLMGSGGNWSLGAGPNGLPVLFDAAAANGHLGVSLAADASVRGMLFKESASGAGFTFDGTGKLTIGYTGIRNESTATQTFNAGIVLSASQNWEAVNGGLAFNGGIDTGTGNLVVIGGDNHTTISGVISGSGSLAKDDGGTLTLNAVNTYTGKTILHNGTVRLGASGNLASTDLTFIAGNEAILDLNGRNQTLGEVRSEFGGTGRILLGGATLTVSSTGSGAFQYLGTIEGSGNVVKTGTGTWVISGTGSYDGYTQVNNGALRVLNTTALSGASNIRLNGGVLELGASNLTANLGTGAGQVQFLGSGGFSAYGGDRIVNLGGNRATLTWGSNSFVPLGSNLILSSTNSNALVELQNGIDLAGATRTISVVNGSAIVDARITGALANGGLIKAGTGILELSGNNTYAGTTSILGGSLLVSSAGALGSGNVNLNAGILVLGAGDFARSLGTGAGQVRFDGTGGFGAYGADRVVNLGGAGETLTWASTARFLINGASFMLSSVAANATVDFQNSIDLNGAQRYVNVQDGSAVIDAKLSGNLSNGSILKQGVGVLQLSGNNTFAGGLEIQGGGVLATSANGLGAGNVVLNGGVVILGAGNFTGDLGTGSGQIQFTGNGGFAAYGADRVVNIGGAGAALTWGSGNFVASGKTLILSSVAANATVDLVNSLNLNSAARTIQVDEGTAAVDARISGIISNGSLTKTGAGTLEFTAANTYTGSTTIAGGALRISNSAAMSNTSFVLDGGVLELAFGDYTGSLSALVAGQVAFGGSGGFSASGGDRTVNIGGAGATLKMNITPGFITKSSQKFMLSSSGADSTIIIENPIDVNWSSMEFAVANGSAAVDARLKGEIINGKFTKSGAGTMELAYSSSYLRTVTVSGGTLLITGVMGWGDGISVEKGGTLRYAATSGMLSHAVLNGGSFFYNSSAQFTRSVTFTSGILGGSGNLSATTVSLALGRTIAPGAELGLTGALRTASEVWDNGGSYLWEINNLAGTKGGASGWDWLNISGSLSLLADTGGFVLKLDSLGALAGWDSGSSYTWTIASFTSGASGFDPSKFSFDTTSFADENALTGSFQLAISGNNLNLTYVPIPEPGSVACVVVGLIALWPRLRRCRVA